MLGTVLLMVCGVVYSVYRLSRAEERKHQPAAMPVYKKNWSRYALPGFAIVYIGICGWVSAGDWQTPMLPVPTVPMLSDDTYRGAILVNHAVVLDLGAAWCVSCKKTAPEFARLATEHHDSFRCFTMDVDQSPITAKFLNVELLPCILVIVDGRVLSRRTGPATERELHEWVEAHLPKD